MGALLCAACTHQHLSPEDEIKARMEAMHEAVGRYVTDPQRAAQLNSTIDGIEADLVNTRELFASARLEAETLNANPEATRADFETLVSRFAAERKSVRARLIERHLQLLSATTSDEWKKLARYERDALTSAEH